jgi:hypothetical protein
MFLTQRRNRRNGQEPMTLPNDDQPQDARAIATAAAGTAAAATPAPVRTAARRAPFPVAHWVVGTVLALAGGLVARLIAPGLADPARGFAAAAGHAAAGLGLLVIALGVRKRVWAANAAATDAATTANTTTDAVAAAPAAANVAATAAIAAKR